MFVSSVGALNAANHQPWQHVPRKWPEKGKKGEGTAEEPQKDETIGPGVRRAAEPKIGKSKEVDPLAELRKEILGE